jgi:hypothetical protein
MRLILVSAACSLALTALVASAATAAPARATKLSPTEQKWVTPLLKVFNVMNAELHLVLSEEAADNALIAASGKNNTLLTKTLIAFADCTPAVKSVGKVPSVRMTAFLTALESSCTHLSAGAHDVGKAIGAIGKANSKLAKSYLIQSTSQFKTGSNFLAVAEKQLIAIGGKSIFTA